jgi:hypothetical protein
MLIRKTQLKRPASALAAGVACAIALSLATGPAFAEWESQADNPAVDWQPTTAFAGCVELRAEIATNREFFKKRSKRCAVYLTQ